MTTREQLTAERLTALIEVLVSTGAIPRDWADSVNNVHELEHGPEVARAARDGRGPPSWATNDGGNE